MIYFSYFNFFNKRGLPSVSKQIYSIANTQYTNYPELRMLRPNIDDVRKLKKGIISIDILKQNYRQKIEKMFNDKSYEEFAKEYDNCILCCHEVVGCHREELMLILQEHNIACKELEVNDID